VVAGLPTVTAVTAGSTHSMVVASGGSGFTLTVVS
jgi:hypothetical protein